MKKIFLFAVVMIALGACAAPSPTATPVASRPEPPKATIGARTANIKEIINKVDSRTTQAQEFGDAAVGQTLNVGSQARTGGGSKTRLDFVEGTIVRLGENTILTVEELGTSDNSPLTRFQLELGKLWIALHGGTLDVKTPAGIVSVRGSYAILEVLKTGMPPPDDIVVRFVLLEGLGGFGNMNLTNMQGLNINREGRAMRFEVIPAFLMDFCDNNVESCPTLLKLLGIQSIDKVQDMNDKNPAGPGKEAPGSPPCRPRFGC